MTYWKVVPLETKVEWLNLYPFCIFKRNFEHLPLSIWWRYIYIINSCCILQSLLFLLPQLLLVDDANTSLALVVVVSVFMFLFLIRFSLVADAGVFVTAIRAAFLALPLFLLVLYIWVVLFFLNPREIINRVIVFDEDKIHNLFLLQNFLRTCSFVASYLKAEILYTHHIPSLL